MSLISIEQVSDQRTWDEFAMAALSGVCANPQTRGEANDGVPQGLIEAIADTAYALADAMMARRLAAISTDKQVGTDERSEGVKQTPLQEGVKP